MWASEESSLRLHFILNTSQIKTPWDSAIIKSNICLKKLQSELGGAEIFSKLSMNHLNSPLTKTYVSFFSNMGSKLILLEINIENFHFNFSLISESKYEL